MRPFARAIEASNEPFVFPFPAVSSDWHGKVAEWNLRGQERATFPTGSAMRKPLTWRERLEREERQAERGRAC